MDFKKAVDIDTATADITRWLDFKKVSEKKRETKADAIDSLIDSVCEGNLTVGEDCVLKQKLIYPFDGELKVLELTFKNRLRVDEVKVKSNASEDAFAFITPYVSALTGLPIGVIKKMDMEDFKIAQSIANFFM